MHLQLDIKSDAYFIVTHQYSIQPSFGKTMSPFVLSLLIMVLVEVQCFRTPLPYGTGFQGTIQDDELSGQGIFHLLGKAFKHAFSTNDPPLKQPKMEGNINSSHFTT